MLVQRELRSMPYTGFSTGGSSPHASITQINIDKNLSTESHGFAIKAQLHFPAFTNQQMLLVLTIVVARVGHHLINTTPKKKNRNTKHHHTVRRREKKWGRRARLDGT